MALPMPDPAPVTIAVLPSRRMISTPLWHNAVALGPAEAVGGARARLVFATDPSPVAEADHCLEHGAVIDLALVGLAARWHRGDLRVAYDGKKFLEAFDQIAADNLQVIEVE